MVWASFQNFCVLTSRGLLGHAVGSIQGQNGVLGQRLLGCVVSFSGATAVTEQVEVSLRWPWAGSASCCSRCRSLCGSAGHVTGAHLKIGKRSWLFKNLQIEAWNKSDLLEEEDPYQTLVAQIVFYSWIKLKQKKMSLNTCFDKLGSLAECPDNSTNWTGK